MFRGKLRIYGTTLSTGKADLHKVRAPSTDVKNSEKKGLLWILDEQAMFPGASEDSFLERVFAQHGEQQVRS